MSEENDTKAIVGEDTTDKGGEYYDTEKLQAILDRVAEMDKVMVEAMKGMSKEYLEKTGLPMGVFRDLATLVTFHALVFGRKMDKPTMRDAFEAVGTLTAHLCATKQMGQQVDMSVGKDDGKGDD